MEGRNDQKLKEIRMNWYKNLGMSADKLHFADHEPDKRAHYAKYATDIEYEAPFGWSEMEGIHHRGDYDLKNHIELSGANLSYKDPVSEKEFVPYVIEPTFGLDRIMLAVLLDAYSESEARSGQDDAVHETEIILRLPKQLAPIKVAVLPLSKKEELTQPALEILNNLQKNWMCQYDETGSIGKRYRRQDEIGTPYCVTVDFETINDQAVTVRDRDTMKQERIKISELVVYLKALL